MSLMCILIVGIDPGTAYLLKKLNVRPSYRTFGSRKPTSVPIAIPEIATA